MMPPEEGRVDPRVCGGLKKPGRTGPTRVLNQGGVFSDDFIDAYIELKAKKSKVHLRHRLYCSV
jgi:glutamine synthetase